jgi:hypothetical protein
MDRAQELSAQGNLALLALIGEISLFTSENPGDARVSTLERHSAVQAVDRRLTEGRTGLTYLSQLLEVAKSEIAAGGYMSEGIRKKIFRMFYSLDLPFALLCRKAGVPEAKAKADHPNGMLRRMRRLR